MASPSSTPPEAEAASLPVEQPTVPDLVEESGVNKKESSKTETAVYLLYDERMTLHQPLTWKASEQRYPCCSDEIPAEYTFENPERIRHMHERLSRLETTAESSIRFHRLECQAATRETILLAHCERHYYSLQHTSILEREELIKKSQVDDDVYYCPDTFLAATLACGGVVSCVDAVTSPTTEHTRAVALVRPPGHHACQEKAMGAYCVLVFNVMYIRSCVRTVPTPGQLPLLITCFVSCIQVSVTLIAWQLLPNMPLPLAVPIVSPLLTGTSIMAMVLKT